MHRVYLIGRYINRFGLHGNIQEFMRVVVGLCIDDICDVQKPIGELLDRCVYVFFHSDHPGCIVSEYFACCDLGNHLGDLRQVLAGLSGEGIRDNVKDFGCATGKVRIRSDRWTSTHIIAGLR
jgi:hypothetical protein